MKIAPHKLPPGTVVSSTHMDPLLRVLAERKGDDTGWWVVDMSGSQQGGLADFVLDSEYIVRALPAAQDPESLRRAGAVALIDSLLHADVLDPEQRLPYPSPVRDLLEGWRFAGYMQAQLDVYEALLEIANTYGLSEAGLPDGGAS